MADEQDNKIFRKKALDRIASPEQLTDYLRVTNPGIWILLLVIILLLAGFFAWASIGKIETKTIAVAMVSEGTAQILTAGNEELDFGMTVRIGKEEYTIEMTEKDESGTNIGYALVPLSDGYYDAEVVLKTVTPISYLLTS